MVRTLLALVLGLTLSLGAALADDKKADNKKTSKKGKEATITKIDPKAHTVTVKMKGKDGKQTEKTFKLAETVRYLDSTGKVAAIDVFKSGDYVLVLEADGQLKEIRKSDKKGNKGEDK
jgi:hypothetical protein